MKEKSDILENEEKIILNENVIDNIDKQNKMKPFLGDPYLDSNYFSRFFFGWAFYILRLAKRGKLTSKMLGKLNKKNDSSFYYQNLFEVWETKGYKKIKNNALFKAILRSNLYKIIILLILSLISFLSDYFSVILLNYFIEYFNNSSEKPKIFSYSPSLLQLGIIYIIMNIIKIFSTVHLYMKQDIFGIKGGFELASFIYNKLIKISNSTFSIRVKQGEIINFIQIDANKLTYMITESPNFFICPIKIIAYFYLLFEFFGYSFFAAIITLIIFFIINFFIFKKYRNAQKDFLEAKDKRIQMTKETIQNMKYLKAFNWENDFEEIIIQKREEELTKLKKRLYITVLNISLFWLLPSLISIITIGFYQYLNDKMDTTAMLMGITLFGKIKAPINQLPQNINTLIEVFVSMKRIETFLNQPEINNEKYKKSKYDINKDYAIKIKNADFTWGIKQYEQNIKICTNSKLKEKIENINQFEIEPEKEKFLLDNEQNNLINNNNYNIDLQNINLKIKSGELVGIIGEIGSGKTTLLEAILNSLIILNPKECDDIYINGSISYVPQIPWIQNETIRNNILFFSEFNEQKYEEVINFSELKYDIINLEGGDLTEIGERGINLSGGQKIRLTLARALYQDSDIYLFDDIFSALDAKIGKKIILNCIVNYLKNKTRLLVTHSLDYLYLMDRIIILKEGKIIFNGDYGQFQKENNFMNLSKKFDNKIEINLNKNFDEIKEKIDEIEKKYEIKKLTLKEDEEIGRIKLSVYNTYAKYMGGKFYLFIVFIMMCIWYIAKSGASLWLSHWSKDENRDKDSNTKWKYFGIYSLFSGGNIFFIFLRDFLLVLGMMKFQRNLHIDMLNKLIKAPINLFYDIIPEGQIMNRFSKDIDNLISSIFIIGYIFKDLLSTIGALINCSIYDLNSFIAIPIFAVLGIIISIFYLRGSRALSRMEAISRSPILNIVSETISGPSSIRAYEKYDNYLDKYYSKINECLKYNICLKGINNWLQEIFFLISLLYIIYLMIRVIIYENEISSQEVSITFNYSVSLQNDLGWLFINCSYFENLLVSMERCIRYTKIKGENFSKKIKNEDLLEKKWPNKGKIEFINYSVRYRPDTEIVRFF